MLPQPDLRRRPIIAGNWKMNKTADEAMDLVGEMIDDLDVVEGATIVLCPPFVALYPLVDLVEQSSIMLGAQNMYFEEAGAYTGEVSPVMVADLCDYVILGHSERRQHFGESDADVNKKVKLAFKHSLIPIMCVGETLAQREAGETEQVVGSQLRLGLAGVPPHQAREMVIAYEPIWAIGTGRAATPQDANATIGYLRQQLRELYSAVVSGAARILYGGSVTAANVRDLMNQPELDGALVGGASLKPDDFVRICAVTAELKGIR
jgi:triosephosphate isomerase (TIM)